MEVCEAVIIDLQNGSATLADGDHLLLELLRAGGSAIDRDGKGEGRERILLGHVAGPRCSGGLRCCCALVGKLSWSGQVTLLWASKGAQRLIRRGE